MRIFLELKKYILQVDLKLDPLAQNLFSTAMNFNPLGTPILNGRTPHSEVGI